MAVELGLRPVDHADEAFQARREEIASKLGIARQVEQERRDIRVVAEPLEAARQRRAHGHHPHRFVPVVGRRDRAGMRAEADGCAVLPERGATELPQVELAAGGALSDA
jgi:hypothetical protein